MEELVVVVSVVAVHKAHSEVIDAPLLDNFFSNQVQITKLLYPIVVQCIFNLIADTLKVTPAPFNAQRVVKAELLVDHPQRVVRPEVVPAVLGQLRHTRVQIAIAHVTVAINGRTCGDMPLHDRHNMLHCLIADTVAHTNTCLPTVHAEDPSYCNIGAKALKALAVDLALVDFNTAWQL